MTQMPTTAERPTASLVGSVAMFGLPDVLSLLATTGQSGELQVVGTGGDGRLWLDHGDLTGAAVGRTESLPQAVFELALLEEGWFYFTAGRVAPQPLPHQGVGNVLSVVRPQIQEWHDLLQKVPLDATVHLAPAPPGPEVQIRAEQWAVLTTLGNSQVAVRDVVSSRSDDHVVTLRLLRDLLEAGLVEVTGTDGSAIGTGPASGLGSPEPGLPPPPVVQLPAPEYIPPDPRPPAGRPLDPGTPGAADVVAMPPPISADPWTPGAPERDPVAADGGGAGT